VGLESIELLFRQRSADLSGDFDESFAESGYHSRGSVAPLSEGRMRVDRLAGLLLVVVSLPALVAASGAPPAPSRTPPPAPARTPPTAVPPEVPATVDLDDLLRRIGERSRNYQEIALRFVCIESIRDADEPRKERRYDYMYVQAEEQRYRPYRQIHTGRLGKTVAEANVDFDFPDSYSWTMMMAPDRQQLFKFKYIGEEWFSLRQTYILAFTAPLPFTSGKTIYEWSGKVWVDAENSNILKVEAEPANQTERLKDELKIYRQAPRFLIYPIGHKPRGLSYNITFLNELHEISLPDQVEVRSFTLDLQGEEEWESQTLLRYSGYQFFGVDVKDLFQQKK
jgi:uncharacterized protein involved in tolerance to divalent cations